MSILVIAIILYVVLFVGAILHANHEQQDPDNRND